MRVTQYNPTIEESFTKLIEVDGTPCRLEILDTAGTVRLTTPVRSSAPSHSLQEVFTALRQLYYDKGDGYILVYSITSESSLSDLDAIWQNLVKAKGTTEVGFARVKQYLLPLITVRFPLCYAETSATRRRSAQSPRKMARTTRRSLAIASSLRAAQRRALTLTRSLRSWSGKYGSVTGGRKTKRTVRAFAHFCKYHTCIFDMRYLVLFRAMTRAYCAA